MPDPVVPTPTPTPAPAATPTPAPAPTPEPAEEVVAARLDAAGARAGLDPAYGDVAAALLKPWLAEHKLGPRPEHLARFMTELRKGKPALFGAGPSTAPVASAPVAPSAGGQSPGPTAQWQALKAAGHKAQAESFYNKHRNAIVAGR